MKAKKICVFFVSCNGGYVSGMVVTLIYHYSDKPSSSYDPAEQKQEKIRKILQSWRWTCLAICPIENSGEKDFRLISYQL